MLDENGSSSRYVVNMTDKEYAIVSEDQVDLYFNLMPKFRSCISDFYFNYENILGIEDNSYFYQDGNKLIGVCDDGFIDTIVVEDRLVKEVSKMHIDNGSGIRTQIEKYVFSYEPFATEVPDNKDGLAYNDGAF